MISSSSCENCCVILLLLLLDVRSGSIYSVKLSSLIESLVYKGYVKLIYHVRDYRSTITRLIKNCENTFVFWG